MFQTNFTQFSSYLLLDDLVLRDPLQIFVEDILPLLCGILTHHQLEQGRTFAIQLQVSLGACEREGGTVSATLVY